MYIEAYEKNPGYLMGLSVGLFDKDTEQPIYDVNEDLIEEDED